MLVLLLAPAAAWCQMPPLHLDQVFAKDLPRSMRVEGAALSAKGSILAWGTGHPPLLLRDTARDWETIPSDSRGIVAMAFGPDGSSVEAVDSVCACILIFDTAGVVRTRLHTRVRFMIESGTRGPSGWYLGGRDRTGNYGLAAVHSDGSVFPLQEFAAHRDSDDEPPVYRLSTDGGDLLAATAVAPFEVTRVAGSQALPVPFVSPVPGAVADSVASEGLWAGMDVIPLDSGYVRTFADLRSDMRLLVLYDRQGELRRVSPVAVPLGMLGASVESHLLLAARTTDKREIVLYRWRWGDEPLTRR
jgi:hypothetical protein